jgi:hypothetical protein
MAGAAVGVAEWAITPEGRGIKDAGPPFDNVRIVDRRTR